jgi:predicted nucleic acid-binding protein
MANEIFVDTSGFFALISSGDEQHASANRIIDEAQRLKRRLVTTDYVINETATLIKARGLFHFVAPFFESLENSRACRIEWTDAERFRRAQAFFLKHVDKAWSFTDCLSFSVMKQLRLHDALTKDQHFGQAGFVVLLA